jgi:hypothetical protein
MSNSIDSQLLEIDLEKSENIDTRSASTKKRRIFAPDPQITAF